MTAGNNGTGTPENDDPFGYLYRGGEGSTEGGGSATHQPGVPRTSHHQVRPVGSRTYGGQQGAAAQRPAPNPHYAAPETLPGGMPPAAGAPQPSGHAAGGSARPNRRGLLIAAIAVVLVVAGGIGVAIMTNQSSGKDDKQNSASDGENPGGDSGESDKSDDSSSKKKEKDKDKKDDGPQNPSANGLKKRDAASLRLSGGATTEKTVKGAEADGGTYITGMNTVGAAVEWTVDVDAPGEYRLNARYGVPGKDANLTIFTNGKGDTRAISMKNFGGTKEGDWEAGWKNTWSLIKLNKGTNTIKLSCEPGNACEVHLDQLWLSAKNG
ncbi:carbohydrate-binding protein [Streptomyces sp. NPDC021096]|uniref:CBM35 domain-containing protein n=1 Tax=Streptomyces sp. NPDC021096 TaxID=3154792 RepID=UPI0034037D2E